eukprot:Plantae.Rhodophyta-Palmaria_palmata.ctg11022.p1 GENE.Plantae.Rhodophyta-Palmaria_palmata.ctg11022~~Plantae.Rhodophyta-Palmaria_palmata.ctg11022.p1  ORF type:complete len:325 (-),score=36.69 Plantae.Rhodophyta-Palmaria_palmata.ctg11022:86-1060(-)
MVAANFCYAKTPAHLVSLVFRYAFVAILAATITSIFYVHPGAQQTKLAPVPMDTRPIVPVFVLVKTVAKDVARRRAMRATWLQDLSSMENFEYKYFCEQPEEEYADALAEEMRLENDIVLIDGLREQKHRKIGIKMIRSFEWIIRNRNVQHIAMTDDDTYLNVPVLLADYPTWVPVRQYLGLHMEGMKVLKVPKGTTRVGKYGETHDFPVATWPRYASGPFYTLSTDLVMAFVNPVLPLRDMSSNDAMTGAVLLPYEDVKYVKRSGLKMWGHVLGAPCTPAKELYAFHLTPWKSGTKSGRGDWAETVMNLHRNITRGDCVPGFS